MFCNVQARNTPIRMSLCDVRSYINTTYMSYVHLRCIQNGERSRLELAPTFDSDTYPGRINMKRGKEGFTHASVATAANVLLH